MSFEDFSKMLSEAFSYIYRGGSETRFQMHFYARIPCVLPCLATPVGDLFSYSFYAPDMLFATKKGLSQILLLRQLLKAII